MLELQMSLSFLNGGIALLGVAAASIPIIIHLLLKQRPRPIVFPALELIRKRHTETVKRLRIRHVLLLCVRIGLVLLVAMALARPTLHSRLFAIDQEAPVACRIVLDTSLSMQYKHHGRTRLEQAKDLAARVVERLPDGSDVAIYESAEPASGVPMDLVPSLARLKAVDIQATSQPLNDAVEVALRSLMTTDRERREIYVFTDLSANAWHLSGDDQLDRLAAVIPGGIRIYVINVGIENPENISVGEIKLDQQVLPASSALLVETSIRNRGPIRDDITVELSVDGKPRDAKPILLPSGQAVEVQFSIPPLDEGLHQGAVTVRAGDPLPFDDVRHFTVEVRPAPRVLVVADRQANVLHWINALDPQELRSERRPRYLVETIDSAALDAAPLASYGVVCLINVRELSVEGWLKLSEFVQSGGGLFVALGDRINRDAYTIEAAKTVLPARPESQAKAAAENSLAPKQFSHPILARFPEWGGADFDLYPVVRYWKVVLEPAARTVIAYTSGDPALVERTFGQGKRGRSLLLSTAVHYDPNTEFWTELPTGWLYVALADQIMRHLSGVTETQLNHLVGAGVTVELNPEELSSLYAVTDPQGQIQRLTPDNNLAVLSVPPTQSVGNWRVDPVDPDRHATHGFSVNAPVEESSLTTVEESRLRDLLGKDRFAIARDPDTLETVVGEARVGRELFPWLMLVVLGLVAMEGYLANRFYRRPAGEAVPTG
jgi:hypothetical protein